MKYFILTYYQYDNYGTRLQNYALQSVLEQLKVEVQTLYLKSMQVVFLNLLKDGISYLPSVTQKQRLWISKRIKRKKFKEFNENINFCKMRYNELKKIDNNNTAFIVGSDQVWSPTHLKRVKHAKELYLMSFLKKCKNKYTYAPSFGTNTIPNDMKKLYNDNIKQFYKVSVREETGRKILEDLSIKNVEIIPDPVFLLTRDNWEKVIEDTNIKKENYILTYFLGKIDKEKTDKINDLANKINCKVINICGNYYRKEDYFASPDEFVKLIKNAKIVFTDSFHAVSFSIIMGTNFGTIKRNDVKQFSRLETLLKRYNLESHIIDENSQIENIAQSSINRYTIDERLLQERDKGIEYLKQIINCSERRKSSE